MIKPLLLFLLSLFLLQQVSIVSCWWRSNNKSSAKIRQLKVNKVKKVSTSSQPVKASSDTAEAPTVWGIRPKNSNELSLPKITRQTLRNVKLWILLSIIGVEASTELFVRMPQEVVYGSSPPAITDNQGADAMVLIFPGAGGPDVHTDDLLHKIQESDMKKGISRYVKVYDWSQWRGNFIRAAFDSQGVGAKVCGKLAQDEDIQHPIRSLHSIGVSVGAFAADSCVKAFDRTKQAVGHIHAQTRLTLLDPFTSKGIFGYGWGVNNFGRGVDVVEDYINTDDPVPTTNDPAKLAFNLDITKSDAKKDFHPIPGESFHSWPVQYLADHWVTDIDDQGQIKFPDKSQEPEGAVVDVP